MHSTLNTIIYRKPMYQTRHDSIPESVPASFNLPKGQSNLIEILWPQ